MSQENTCGYLLKQNFVDLFWKLLYFQKYTHELSKYDISYSHISVSD